MKKGLKIFLSIVLVLAILGGIAALSVTFYGKKVCQGRGHGIYCFANYRRSYFK
ncbi:MAG: hypothetical protein PUF01_00785 [Eubacteriales bacterium]|nr:hypothetical protein [Eubacteriales bacterium]